jgi:hypothetical protein
VEMSNKAEAQLKCETYLNMRKEDRNINMISDDMASIVKRNTKVLFSNEYCSIARLTNPEQRALLLEAMYQIISNTEPLQIFFA